MTTLPVAVGASILFAEEKMSYKVQACNERFAVCTKPFNPKRTVLYTIVDFRKGIRGTENLIFCFGFDTQALCEEALERLTHAESEVSHRNRIPLNIERILEGKGKCNERIVSQ